MRYRLVTEHIRPGRPPEQHVSSALIPLQEVPYALQYEADLHRLCGWSVTDYGQSIRLQRGDIVRWIWVRTRKPLEDTL